MHKPSLHNDKHCDSFTNEVSACEIHVVENTSKKNKKKKQLVDNSKQKIDLWAYPQIF